MYRPRPIAASATGPWSTPRSAEVRPCRGDARRTMCVCTHSRRPTMAGCAHHFCESCYVSWCERGHAACPTCRAPVVAIARDVEYAEVVGAVVTPSSRPKQSADVGETRTALVSKPVGLTLANSAGGVGCLVVGTMPRNGADRASIKKGDLVSARARGAAAPRRPPAQAPTTSCSARLAVQVLAVGGVRVSNHRTAIELIERSLGDVIDLEVKKGESHNGGLGPRSRRSASPSAAVRRALSAARRRHSTHPLPPSPLGGSASRNSSSLSA